VRDQSRVEGGSSDGAVGRCGELLLQKQNLQTPQNRRMKAFRNPAIAHALRAGLILLFAEKLAPRLRDHDERSQTGILTSGLASLPLPVRFVE
jgi:hypothetical protein